MNSGDSAVPTMRSCRCLPLTRAVSSSPGRSPRTLAKPSDTRASMAPSPRAVPEPAGARARPLPTVTWFMRGGWCRSTPMSWPRMGSATPAISTRTTCSTVTCTSATPGTPRKTSASASGARLTVTKASAKWPRA